MISHTTMRFRKAYEELPAEIRKQARQAYKLFLKNPHHPSLRFKSIHSTQPIFSVRIGLNYRAIGVRDDEDMVWYWIGSHAEYDKLIQQFKK